MKKYKYIILALLSCFGTNVYAENWQCGYTITVIADYTDNKDATSSENKNITAYRGANGFAAFVNTNTKFITSFTQNGTNKTIYPSATVGPNPVLSDSYVRGCKGATNVPISYWSDCPYYSSSSPGFEQSTCPSLDDAAGRIIEGDMSTAYFLNGGIGCINIDNPDMYKLYSGEVTNLYSIFCGSVGGQIPKYVTYDSASKSLDSKVFNSGNGCSRNSIIITKGVANTLWTIDDCYIPKDNEIHDASGTYIFTNDCYYQR